MTDTNTTPPDEMKGGNIFMGQKERLLARYGDHLEGEDFSEAEKKEFLITQWQIVNAFVELGFSLQPGETIHPDSSLSFDDVLHSLCLENPAHETVAPPKTRPEPKEQP